MLVVLDQSSWVDENGSRCLWIGVGGRDRAYGSTGMGVDACGSVLVVEICACGFTGMSLYMCICRCGSVLMVEMDA